MATVGIMEAISRRRSIRNFKHTPVPQESIEKLLAAAARTKLARLMVEGADNVESRGDKSGTCRSSARIVALAPVTILVFNAAYEHERNIFDHQTYNAPDIQSIGGRVQTMLLAAEDLGLGTLWICDILFGYLLIREWLARKEKMVTAVSVGYHAETPAARPRTAWQEITEWREEE